MKTKIFLTFFLIVILMFSLSSCYINIMKIGDIPTISYFTIGEEEYVKQEILKCRDVESVEFERRSDYPEDDAYSIYVYLTNNRFIYFEGVEFARFKSDSGRWPIVLCQINDLLLIEQIFEPLSLPTQKSTIKYVSSFHCCTEIKYLSKIMRNMNTKNIISIINNIDYVYDYINSLPELYDNTSEYIYFDGEYNQEMKIPKELENDVPFSIIEQKEYYNSTLKVLRTYEKRYKFYKMPLEVAQKKYPYANLKTDF